MALDRGVWYVGVLSLDFLPTSLFPLPFRHFLFFSFLFFSFVKLKTLFHHPPSIFLCQYTLHNHGHGGHTISLLSGDRSRRRATSPNLIGYSELCFARGAIEARILHQRDRVDVGDSVIFLAYRAAMIPCSCFALRLYIYSTLQFVNTTRYQCRIYGNSEACWYSGAVDGPLQYSPDNRRNMKPVQMLIFCPNGDTSLLRRVILFLSTPNQRSRYSSLDLYQASTPERHLCYVLLNSLMRYSALHHFWDRGANVASRNRRRSA